MFAAAPAWSDLEGSTADQPSPAFTWRPVHTMRTAHMQEKAERRKQRLAALEHEHKLAAARWGGTGLYGPAYP